MGHARPRPTRRVPVPLAPATVGRGPRCVRRTPVGAPGARSRPPEPLSFLPRGITSRQLPVVVPIVTWRWRPPPRAGRDRGIPRDQPEVARSRRARPLPSAPHRGPGAATEGRRKPRKALRPEGLRRAAGAGTVPAPRARSGSPAGGPPPRLRPARERVICEGPTGTSTRPYGSCGLGPGPGAAARNGQAAGPPDRESTWTGASLGAGEMGCGGGVPTARTDGVLASNKHPPPRRGPRRRGAVG